jgi:hypothetical protein
MEAVATAVISAVALGRLSFAALGLAGGRIRQRWLVDRNRVPFVELDHQRQVVRNIGAETAINIALYRLSTFWGAECESVCLKCWSSLLPGEKRRAKALTVCGLQGREALLVQYQNIAGTLFTSVTLAAEPSGDAQRLALPRRGGRRLPMIEGEAVTSHSLKTVRQVVPKQLREDLDGLRVRDPGADKTAGSDD